MKTTKTENAITFDFSSLREIHDFCETSKQSAIWRDRAGRYASETGRESFTGSKSFEDSQDMLLSGCPEIVKKLQCNLAKFKTGKQTPKTKRITDFAGFVPNVAAYCAGAQRTMIRTIKKPVKSTVVNVYYNNSFNYGIEPDQIISVGSELVNALQQIEKNGIRINLYIVSAANTAYKEKPIVVKVKVKDSGDFFSLAKLSYCIAHPSFLRRHVFRIWETVTDRKFYNSRYGYPVKDITSLVNEKNAIIVNGLQCIENGLKVEDVIKQQL